MIRGATRVLLQLGAALCVGIAVLIGLAIWTVSQGPISLAFLTPHVVRAITPEDGLYRVKVDDTVLIWAGWERALDIRLRGVTVQRAAGGAQATVPELSVTLSAQGLMRGLVAPTRIEMFNPRVALMRGADGRIRLDLGGEATGTGELATALLNDLLASPDPERAMGYLTRVAVVDADFVIDDRKLDRSWNVPAADIILERDINGIRGSMGFDMSGADGMLRVAASALYRRIAGMVDVAVNFDGLRPAVFAALDASVADLARVEMPLSGTVALSLDLDGRSQGATFTVTGGPGRLALSELYDAPMPVERMRAVGKFDNGFTQLTIDDLAVESGGVKLNGSAMLTRLGGEGRLWANTRVAAMPMDRLRQFWPDRSSIAGRAWVAERLTGMVRDGTARIAVRLPENDAPVLETLTGSFRYDGMTARYGAQMPPLTELAGTATFTADRMDFELRSGQLRGLQLADGRMSLTGLAGNSPRAAIETAVRGGVREMLEVVDAPPLNYARRAGLAPADMAGEVGLRLGLRFPLVKDLALAQVDASGTATVRGFAQRGLFGGIDVRGGELNVKIDKAGMDAAGTISVAGVPTQVTWRQNFADPSGVGTRITMSGNLSETQRAELGLDLQPYVKGPIGMNVVYSGGDVRTGEVVATANLRDTALALPALGWGKPAGTDGSARIALQLDKKNTVAQVREFQIAAGNLRSNGRIALTADRNGKKRASRIEFDRFALDGTDLRGAIDIRPAGGYTIEVAGPALNAAPLLDRMMQGGGDPAQPIQIIANIDRVVLGPKRELHKVRGGVAFDGTVWNAANVRAQMTEGKTVEYTLSSERGTRRVMLTAEDAGALLRTFDMMDTIVGGRLVLAGVVDDRDQKRPVKGSASVSDFRLVKAPAMAKVLNETPLAGVNAALAAEGMGFATFDANYALFDDRVEIENGRMVGGDVGVTLAGKIDRKSETVALDGTIVPAYTLNSAIGKIPLLGTLLTGGQGGGIFAATYRVAGRLQDPEVSVNPLSVLTPGILRNIFGMVGSATSVSPAGAAELHPAPNTNN